MTDRSCEALLMLTSQSFNQSINQSVSVCGGPHASEEALKIVQHLHTENNILSSCLLSGENKVCKVQSKSFSSDKIISFVLP